jgi:hypothetical protein
MGASLTKIDCHYGHLVHDGRGHAIRLLDEISAPANVHGGRWWTLRGRQSRQPPPAKTTEVAAKQAKPRSPLTDSNRRPLLTMERLRQPVATRGNGFRLFSRFWLPAHLPPVATGCDRSAP